MITENFFSPTENFQNNPANVANVDKLNLDDAIDPKEALLSDACKCIDETLDKCEEQPGLLISSDFINAFKLIKVHNAPLATEYRVKLKKAKPSGVSLAEIDKLINKSSPEAPGNDNVTTELITLAQSAGVLFYDEKSEQAFISIEEKSAYANYVINSKNFTDWISYQYYSLYKKAANDTAIRQAQATLAGIAKHEGRKETVFLRVAAYESAHYLFLANDKMQVIEVMATGWRIIDHSPVKFWKPNAMQALPIPQSGKHLDLIWKYLNIQREDRPLLLAWILESFRSNTPKPILNLCGIQGSAKSSTQNKIRQLIDNNVVNLRSAPKSIQDIFVGAGCNWLMSYENISHLNAQMQDSFCTLATGGGFATRALYSNVEETIIDAKRPVIINGIPHVITAQDLTDRAICLELPKIEFREEIQLDQEWEQEKPFIFGALLDLFVKTLSNLPSVNLKNPPRMADFTKLGEAMMIALGNPEGEFTRIYRTKLSESIIRALDASPAAVAITAMVENHHAESAIIFYGTMQLLLEKLTAYRKDSENWPKSPRGLSDVIRRQMPALSLCGIDITIGNQSERIGHNERGVPVTIKKKSVNIGNIGSVISEVSMKEKKISDSDEMEVFLMGAILEMTQAGFTFELLPDNKLGVRPSKLTQQQRTLIQGNKAEIIQYPAD